MNFNNILFLDIETVSQFPSFEHLTTEWRVLWETKASAINRNNQEGTAENTYPKAGIYAEFGKIVCISCGCLLGMGENKKLVIKSYYDANEKKLLTEFGEMLKAWSGDAEKFLCAHNGKEFDYPFICRRMIINGVTIPEILNISGKKPWEVRHLDTMELWRFGDYKNYTSLKLLAQVLGIPSPKDDIDGSMVNGVYWGQKDLDRIVEYCQKDVITLTQVMLRFHCLDVVKNENISIKYVQQQN